MVLLPVCQYVPTLRVVDKHFRVKFSFDTEGFRWNALQTKPARQTCRSAAVLMNVIFVVALLDSAGESGSLSTFVLHNITDAERHPPVT
jgi:hypothetical protein